MKRRNKERRRFKRLSGEYGNFRKRRAFRGHWALGALVAALCVVTLIAR